ncbi:unnamed protein product [Allacma fusca]|uniref:Cytochrome c oxidase subunit 7C, mitochondrial n=1 Tax=Allacma fusca TaxID=39272 RepID=A0A8J2MB39_9HEXA|nr:unnamed protein product [Allacma fusca]
MIVARRIGSNVRTLMTSAVRRSGHHHVGGIPGDNLPFSISNRFRLAVYIGGWLGSGFSVPFIILRHQLKKN